MEFLKYSPAVVPKHSLTCPPKHPETPNHCDIILIIQKENSYSGGGGLKSH